MDRNLAPVDIGRTVQLTAEPFREEKSNLPERFKRGLERAIMISVNNKEWRDKTPAGQHKDDFATQGQPKREALRDAKNKLGDAPEKISGAEIYPEKPKLEDSAIEESARSPFSAEKSLPDSATGLVYQSRPSKLPDYLEKEHEPGTAPSQSAPPPQPQEPRAPQASDEYRTSLEYAAALERDIAKSFDVPIKPGEALKILEEGTRRYLERHPDNIPPPELFEDDRESE